MCAVFPGVALDLARLFLLSSLLMTEDFPTLDLPAKTICGSPSRIKSFSRGGTDELYVMKIQSFMLPVLFVVVCLLRFFFYEQHNRMRGHSFSTARESHAFLCRSLYTDVLPVCLQLQGKVVSHLIYVR